MFKKKSKSYQQSVPLFVYQKKKKKPIVLLLLATGVGAVVFLIANQWQPIDPQAPPINYTVDAQVSARQVDKKLLREQLTPYVHQGQYPSSMRYQGQDLSIQYTLDPGLQTWAEKRLKRYNPDYASFVALDPDTGKVLALASTRRDGGPSAQLPFKATYPGASTFKLITAVAAIAEGVAKPQTSYAFNGKSTSLYKSQVFNTQRNKWTRDMDLTTAFAKSVNPVFGRIGAKHLGGQTLARYAHKFGYNAQFSSDFDFDNGSVEIDLNDEWQIVEAASGYTRANTLSPVHGAAIAASIVNGGQLIPPSIVESVRNASGRMLYQSEPAQIEVINPATSAAMQTLMSATVTKGSARKTFRNLFKKNKFEGVVAGAKTGHLRGNNPKGSYDWIIGYATYKGRKIAFAVMCINKEKWYVKSGVLAREALEYYFKSADLNIAKVDEEKQR